ncbi:MAG: glycosyltransferase family 2 protein [Marinosulfonomonas sp.]
MKIYVHIGMPGCGTARLQQVLEEKRDKLAAKGVLYPSTPGKRSHAALFMAMTDPDHVDPLRWQSGYAQPEKQAGLAARLTAALDHEIAEAKPDTIIFSAEQFAASLAFPAELERLRVFLKRYCDDIKIVAHIDEQARVLARHYGNQILDGRIADLHQDLGVAAAKDWRGTCLQEWTSIAPKHNAMPEIQSTPFWLDYPALLGAWETAFGAGSVRLRPYDADLFYSANVTEELSAAFDLAKNFGKSTAAPHPTPPSAGWLTRCREMNELFQIALQTGRVIPRQMWRHMLGQLSVPGAALDAGGLFAISDRFTASNAALLADHLTLTPACLTPDPKQAAWAETPTSGGFRATQYMAAFLPIIDQSQATSEQATRAPRATGSGHTQQLSPAAVRIFPPLAVANFEKLQGSQFAPHNNLGRINEQERGAPFHPVPSRALPPGSSGTVIVACMKNEGPYILEWIAYHQSIGVDQFLIYTNDCTDGTRKILDHLQARGIVHHRNNDNWKGNSPQQHALNKSLSEEVIRTAEWIAHIDVDEFINVRCGNGTLQDFRDAVPDATNVAMTWRLFGHNGVKQFKDEPVIEQFDLCAPKYCPKPHTVWGFKTMFKNIGAYNKISCHRPNKLDEAFREQVKWVNGSGRAMAEQIKDRGWRSDIRSIGYDLIQLNHYALRSADSFLIKRQRGRALHVGRTIGLNYWIRMDWSVQKDITIKRNLPRLKAQLDRLLADPDLAQLHQQTVRWHKKRAATLRETPEFRELYTQALQIDLNDMERVAFGVALDTDS